MKRFKIVLFFAFLSTGLFAQTDNISVQATKLVENMNKQIISENPALALSEKQKTEIGILMTERSIAYGDASKAEKDEEKRKEAQKEVVKPFNRKIFGEVLSKEQKVALDTARSKENGGK